MRIDYKFVVSLQHRLMHGCDSEFPDLYLLPYEINGHSVPCPKSGNLGQTLWN